MIISRHKTYNHILTFSISGLWICSLEAHSQIEEIKFSVRNSDPDIAVNKEDEVISRKRKGIQWRNKHYVYYYFYSTLYYCEKTSVFTVISCVKGVIVIIFLLEYKVGFSSITFILFIFRDRARKVHIINAVSESLMIIEHLSRKKVFIDDPYPVSNILERSEKFAKLDEDQIVGYLTAGLVIQDIRH